MKRVLISLEAIPQNQLLTIELEDLVKTPLETISILFDFLGLTYLPEHLPGYVSILKNPNDAHVNRYLTELSPEDAKKIDQHCAALYKDLSVLHNSKNKF